MANNIKEQDSKVNKKAEENKEISQTSSEKEQEYLARIAELEEQIAYYKKALFGQKSEKTETVMNNAEQINIFNEVENEATEDLTREVKVSGHTRKAKKTHKESFENLPVEEVIHEVEDRTCPECGMEMETVGKEFVRDEVVYVPAKLFVRKHFVEVLKCAKCSSDESRDEEKIDVPATVFKKAIAPESIIPRSYCSAELAAHVIYEKYGKAVPLYRQEKDYEALGMKISRNTMANWIIYIAKVYGKPVYELMKQDLLKNSVIHADETVTQVLKEEKRKAKTQSRMWVYCAPKSSTHENILYQYTATRSGENAAKFLGDYSGYLVCDGYDGYNKLDKVSRAGCWAHLRRRLVEALPTDKELVSKSKAKIGLDWCNQVFEIEREIEGLSREDKIKQRQERSKIVLDGFFSWLQTFEVAGGSKLAKAVQYAMNEKKYLYKFLEDPDIAPDNNRAENAIRPYVVGRKNWMFNDSVKGAEASSIIYSLLVTAYKNGLAIEKYFKELITSKDPVLPWNN